MLVVTSAKEMKVDDFEGARGILAHLVVNHPAIQAHKTYQTLHAILSE